MSELGADTQQLLYKLSRTGAKLPLMLVSAKTLLDLKEAVVLHEEFVGLITKVMDEETKRAVRGN